MLGGPSVWAIIHIMVYGRGILCGETRQLFGILSAILQFDTLYMYNAFDGE